LTFIEVSEALALAAAEATEEFDAGKDVVDG
jgi:hypothetical protein